MASIGNFGTAYEPVDLDFGFFGETIRVHPEAGAAALTEFIAGAADIAAEDEPAGAKFILDFLRQLVHPEDFDRFWSLAKAQRQHPMRDLMPIGKAIVEAVSGFPTGQSSASPTGPVNTGQKFAVDLPSQDFPTAVPTPQTAADKALAMLRGRPDLQEFVVKQEEAQRERNGGTPVTV